MSFKFVIWASRVIYLHGIPVAKEWIICKNAWTSLLACLHAWSNMYHGAHISHLEDVRSYHCPIFLNSSSNVLRLRG
ncbi:conserved hypothetical protein [Ricinus communis]|uniref:Uncharacterized protein n=1 Tax=Ricinus communis TaxID=3988 RepID=B9RVL3_RICCO|nr:conserved hypothetical protein [Ricinus communis]